MKIHQSFRKLPTVHAGHDHIGDEQLNGTFACHLGHLDGFFWPVRGQNRVTQPLQYRLGHFQNGGVIFHQQEGFVVPSGGGVLYPLFVQGPPLPPMQAGTV